MLECLTYESLAAVPGTIAHHYKQGNINWPMSIYISLVHIVAFYGLFRVVECQKETLLLAFLLWPVRYVRKMVRYLA
jgi:hypothetical protein